MKTMTSKLILVIATIAIAGAASADYLQTVQIGTSGIRERKAASTWEGEYDFQQPPQPIFENRHVFEITFSVHSGGGGGLPSGGQLITHGSGYQIHLGIRIDLDPERGIGEGANVIGKGQMPLESGLIPEMGEFLICGLGTSGSVNLHVTATEEEILGGTTIHVICHRQFQVWDEGLQQWVTRHRYELVEYDLQKLLLDGDASIDTRMGYFDGNAIFDGVTWPDSDPDPNVDPAYVRFGGWKYKGGLFAGFMQWMTMDRSGLARLQLFGSNGMTTENDRSCLSLFYIGWPPKYPNPTSVTLGAYWPLANDGNIERNEYDVTWKYRWNINPTSGDPGQDPKHSEFPLSTITFGAEAAEDYRCWSLHLANDETQWSYGDGICIAIDNEPNAIGIQGQALWRYFACKEFQEEYGEALGFPYGDVQPRIWKLLVTDFSSWTE